MFHTIFIKCKVDVMYFIFIFISPTVPRFSVKKFVNQLIKNKRPNQRYMTEASVTQSEQQNLIMLQQETATVGLCQPFRVDTSCK